MKTKYDWSGVHPDIKWIATDSDGFKCYFTSKPEMMPIWWERTSDYYRCIAPNFNEYQGNWQDSLEERPSEND